MLYNLVNRGGHIEVLDDCGRFVFSADTIGEANRELNELEKEQAPLNWGAVRDMIKHMDVQEKLVWMSS